MHYADAVWVYLGTEAVALCVFPLLTSRLGPKAARPFDKLSILKGNLERLVLFTAFIHDFPQMLIAFSAMKLGTRLHSDKEADISNTYFLVGNLISIFLAMVGAIVVKRLGAA